MSDKPKYIWVDNYKTKNDIIDDIGKIREKNNDVWIELEKLEELIRREEYEYYAMNSDETWNEIRLLRIEQNKVKMVMLKKVFEKYPKRAKEIFKKITENDRQINELSKELCK